MSKPIYVVGHRNPDTDSICSALAYAYLKRQLGENVVAARTGAISSETSYALEYFGIEAPLFIHDFYPRARDIMNPPPHYVRPDDTVFKLGQLINEAEIKSIPVLNEKDEFVGIVSAGDLAKLFLRELSSLDLGKTGTTFAALAQVLTGEVLSGAERLHETIEGKLKIAGASLATIKKNFTPGNIVLVGDRADVHKACLEIGVSCLVLTGADCKIETDFLKEAQRQGMVVIHGRYDTYTCARLINQSIPVKSIMQTKLITFEPHELVEDIKGEITSSNFRNFPVVDKSKLVGMLKRNNLLMPQKQEVILVDHNELSQAIEGIEYTKIKEIIDHHRLGGMQTNEPIYIVQQPVGCTATIIASLYEQVRVEIPKKIAGLLVSAILSDTVLFKSPTTTQKDKNAAAKLAQIAEIQLEEYGLALLKAGANLTKKAPEEIVQQDLKELHLGNYFLAIAQVYILDNQELFQVKNKLKKAMQELKQKKNYDFFLFLATNIMTQNTELLVVGEPEKIIQQAFKQSEQKDSYQLPGVMSRKKQIIPPLAQAIEELGPTS